MLTLSIDNAGNTVDVTEMAFTDPLPAGLVAAAAPGVSNGCAVSSSTRPTSQRSTAIAASKRASGSG